MNLKIRDKIIGIMLVLIILPTVLIGWRSYTVSKNALTRQYEEMGEIVSFESNALIKSKIEENNKLLKDLSTLPALYSLGGEEIEIDESNRLLDKLGNTMEVYDFSDIYFGSVNGKVYSPSDEDSSGVVPQERPWYIDALESDEVIWSEVYEDVRTGELLITASYAVYNGDKLEGVVAADIDLASFSKDITEVDIAGGYPILLDQDGVIISDRDPNSIGQEFQALNLFDKDSDQLQMKEYTYTNEENNSSQDQLIVFRPVDNSKWKVAIIIGMDSINTLNTFMMQNMIFIGLITVIIGVIIAVVFGRRISNSINEVLGAIRKMEEGDFTTRIHTKSTDEFGELRDRFNSMMVTLSDFIEKIKGASVSVDEYSGNLAAISQEVNASSYEVSTTAEQIAKGTSNQASDTEEGVVLINYMSDKLVDLDSTSESMVTLAEEIRRTNDKSTLVVDDLKEKTELNNESSKRVRDEILELDRRIGEVSEILSTIDQISEQTNLLALNASIEAARAGEYGRGFAVVADEIRELAGESKESSNNIKNIIEAVQDESKVTVSVVGEVNDRNEEQTQAVERVNESFDTINNLIEQIVSRIKDIDEKSTEMNNDRNKIVNTIENISSISQETAAASEEVTASIEEQTSATEEVANSASKLNELAHQLNREISIFKI